MIAVMFSPWVIVGLGTTTLVVYARLRLHKIHEQDASGLALLAGSILLLILQSLGIVS